MRRSLLAGSAIFISSQALAGTPLYVCTHAGCARDAAAAIAAETAASTAAANAQSAATSAAGSIASLAATVLGYGSTITSLSSSFTTLLNEVTGFSGTISSLSASVTSNGASLSTLSAGLASETARAEIAEAAAAAAASVAASTAGSASTTAASALSTAASASGSVAAASAAAASATASLTALSGTVTSNSASITSLGASVTSNTGSIGTLSAGLATETNRAVAAEATKPSLNPLTGRSTLAQAPVDYQNRAPLPTDDGQNLPTSTGPCVVGGYWAWTGPDGAFHVASDDSCVAGQAVHTLQPNPGFVLDVIKSMGLQGYGWGTFRMARSATNMGHWTDGGSSFVGTLASATGSASTTLTFNASVAGTLSAGQNIQGPSIPLGDSIASVSGSIVTLAAATTGTIASGAETFTVFNGGTVSLLSSPPYTADYAALDAATQATPVQCANYPDLISGGYCPTQVYVDTLYEQSGSGYNSEPTYGLLFATGTNSITGTQKNNDTVELGTIAGTNGTSVWGAELDVAVSGGGTLTPTSQAATGSMFDKMGEYAVPFVGDGAPSTVQTQTSVTCGSAGCETALTINTTSYLQAPMWDAENDVGGVRGVILNSVPVQIGNQLSLNKLIYIPGISNSVSYTTIMIMRHGADDQGQGAGLIEFVSTGKEIYDTGKVQSNSNPDYISETGTGGVFSCPLSVKDSPSILMIDQAGSNTVTCAVDNAIATASISSTFAASTGLSIGGGQGVNSYGREVFAGAIHIPTAAITAAQWSKIQLSLIYGTHIVPEQSASIVCVACDSRMTTNGDLSHAEHATNMLPRYLPRLTSVYNAGVSGEQLCASITGSAAIGTGLGNMTTRMQGKYDPSLQWEGFIVEDLGTDISAGTSVPVIEACLTSEVNGLRSNYPVAGGAPHIILEVGELGCRSFGSGSFANVGVNNQVMTWLYQYGFVSQANGGLGLTPGWDIVSSAALNAVVSPGLTLSTTVTANVTSAAASGATTLTFSPIVAAGLSVGETIQESAIPGGTTLTSVNGTTGVVTLSAATTGTIGTGNNVYVWQPESAGSTQVLLATTSTTVGVTLSVGEPVYTAAPVNTTITAINGNTITISAGLTAALGENATLTFGDYATSNGTVSAVNESGTLLCGTLTNVESQALNPELYTYDNLHPSHALDQFYEAVWGQETGALMQRY